MLSRPTFILLFSASLFAADPAGFLLWEKGVPPGGKGAKFDNHGISISHRDKNGVAELHEKQTDILIVQSGEAVLEVGGEVVDPKTESAGEIRGPSIRNGVKKNVAAGDVIHIPAKTPHQFFVDPGKRITYVAIKVDSL